MYTIIKNIYDCDDSVLYTEILTQWLQFKTEQEAYDYIKTIESDMIHLTIVPVQFCEGFKED